jgi:hypothetical protein
MDLREQIDALRQKLDDFTLDGGRKAGTTVRSRAQDLPRWNETEPDELLTPRDEKADLYRRLRDRNATDADALARLQLSDDLSDYEDNLIEWFNGLKEIPGQENIVLTADYQSRKKLGGNPNHGSIEDLQACSQMLIEWEERVKQERLAMNKTSKRIWKGFQVRFQNLQKVDVGGTSVSMVLHETRSICQKHWETLMSMSSTSSLFGDEMEDIFFDIDDILTTNEAQAVEITRQLLWIRTINPDILTDGIDESLNKQKFAQMSMLKVQLISYISAHSDLRLIDWVQNSESTMGTEAYIRKKFVQYGEAKGVALLPPMSKAAQEWAAFVQQVDAGWCTLRDSNFNIQYRGVNISPKTYSAPPSVLQRLQSTGSALIRGGSYKVSGSQSANLSLHRTMPKASWTTNSHGDLVKSYVFHL